MTRSDIKYFFQCQLHRKLVVDPACKIEGLVAKTEEVYSMVLCRVGYHKMISPASIAYSKVLNDKKKVLNEKTKPSYFL